MGLYYKGSTKKDKSINFLTIQSIIASYGSHFYDKKICKTSAYAFKNLCACDLMELLQQKKMRCHWFSKYAVASFVNDSMCDECYNAQIIACPVHKYAAYVVSSKPIRSGDEIFVSYGKAFWDSPHDPSNPDAGSRMDNVSTTYRGFCSKHSAAEEEEDELWLYS